MLDLRQALLQPRGPGPLCREANGLGIHAQSWKSSLLAGNDCRGHGHSDSVATGVINPSGFAPRTRQRMIRRLLGGPGGTFSRPNTATPVGVPTYTWPLTIVGVMNLLPLPNESRPFAAWVVLYNSLARLVAS